MTFTEEEKENDCGRRNEDILDEGCFKTKFSNFNQEEFTSIFRLKSKMKNKVSISSDFDEESELTQKKKNFKQKNAKIKDGFCELCKQINEVEDKENVFEFVEKLACFMFNKDVIDEDEEDESEI